MAENQYTFSTQYCFLSTVHINVVHVHVMSIGLELLGLWCTCSTEKWFNPFSALHQIIKKLQKQNFKKILTAV